MEPAMRLIHAPVALGVLLLAACATTQPVPATRPAATNVARTSWQADITAISGGSNPVGRGAAITAALGILGLQWREQAFQGRGRAGRNLIAEVGGPAGAPLLLIGAHYDRVAVGQGATDNASGVATVLQLAAALQARPLARHRVQVVFWDMEEDGLLGSRAFVATAGQERPALYVNFDVFAWGDTLWMMTPHPDGPLAAEAAAAARANGLHHRAGTEYPNTDHRTFLAAGWPAVSFSLLANTEIEDTLKFFTGGQPAQVPKAGQVLHTAQDTLDKIDGTHVPQALKALEDALRAWDAK
jgi:aminopeptidase S